MKVNSKPAPFEKPNAKGLRHPKIRLNGPFGATPFSDRLI